MMRPAPTTARARSSRPERPNRAISHGQLFAIALAGLLLTSCEPGGGQHAVAESGTASTSTLEGALQGTLEGHSPGERRRNPLPPPALEITDADIPEPLVGTPVPAAEAIEIVPDQVLPPGLPISDAAREEILELLRQMQPLDPTLTSDHHDKWYILNRRRIERLEREERVDIGWAALHAFSNYPGRNAILKNRLLRIGARVSPDEAKGLLKTVTFTYGIPIEDRTSALEFLPEVDPQAVFEGARSILERNGRRTRTDPDDEFFVAAWIKACEVADQDPVPMLATVATNFALDPIARYTAVEELQHHGDDRLAQATLEQVLVESTGDAYIRRKAAQSILVGYSSEQACALLRQVLDREADLNFARFLDDAIQTNCR